MRKNNNCFTKRSINANRKHANSPPRDLCCIFACGPRHQQRVLRNGIHPPGTCKAYCPALVLYYLPVYCPMKKIAPELTSVMA